jgi:HEAT repeat protein
MKRLALEHPAIRFARFALLIFSFGSALYAEDMSDSAWGQGRTQTQSASSSASAKQSASSQSAQSASSAPSATARTPRPEDLEYWRETMLYGTPSQKEDALKTMQNYRTKEVDTILIDTLKNESEGAIQRRIIQLLYERQVEGALKPLEEALKKAESPDTQASAIAALAKFKDKSILPIIVQYVTNIEVMVQQEAVRAIGAIGNPEPAAQLLEMLDTLPSEHDLRYDLVNALGELKYAPAYDSLHAIAMNTANSHYMRSFAITALGRIGEKRVIPDLIRLLQEEPNPSIKMRVVAAFGDLSATADALPAIRAAMADGDEQVRAAAVKTAGKTGDKELLKAILYRFRYDNEPRVMLAAAEALQEAEHPELPALLLQRFDATRDTSLMSRFIVILKKCPPQAQSVAMLRKKQDENKFSKVKDEIEDLLTHWRLESRQAASTTSAPKLADTKPEPKEDVPERIMITE